LGSSTAITSLHLPPAHNTCNNIKASPQLYHPPLHQLFPTMPSPTDQQRSNQQRNPNNPPPRSFPTDQLDAAALDARIEELTRRRSEMARRAAAGTDAPPQGGMANIAGAAADSFAQAFVDRFASSNGMMMRNGGDMKDKRDGANAIMPPGYDMMCGMANNGPDMEFMQGQMMMNRISGGQQPNSMGNDMPNNMGMNFPMNPGMAMQGVPMNPNFDRRNSQMSMEGQTQQAFQNWQQSQQMNPYFQQMQRMGMMGGGGVGMMPPNGPHPWMHHPMMMPQVPPQPAGNVVSNPPETNLDLEEKKSKKSKVSAAAPPKQAPKKRAPTTELQVTPELVEASKGPFKTLDVSIPLALDRDQDWLTPLHCFVRRNCVEAFTATENDIVAPSKGKRKPVQIGQVGIRCPHCHVSGPKKDNDTRERGSIYYPNSLSSIYNATMNLLQRHIHSCPRVPKAVMEKYADLKQDDARSGTSKKYWIESAKSIGLVDTLKGIRLSADAPPPLKTDFCLDEDDGAKKESEGDKAEGDGIKDEGAKSKKKDDVEAVPLILPSDKDNSTTFSYLLLSQMQPCVFTEADRLGKRKGLPTGFAGLACRHCFGGYGSGRFFPSSIKTLSDTSKTLNVLHNHMTRCRKCPPEVLTQLAAAKETHDEERSKMKFGSQKSFFAKIWSRLHDNRPYDPVAVRVANAKPIGDGAAGGSQSMPMQYPTGNDMAFMTGQMGMMNQMPMLPGGPQPMPMMGGPPPPGVGGPKMMGGPPMGMGMMPPEMMMRGYPPDQFMNGGINHPMGAQFGNGNGGQASGSKRSVEEDLTMESNKRVRESEV
jgi:hypothetical protein